MNHIKLALAALLVFSGQGAAGAGHRVAVVLTPRFGGAPLTFDAPTNTTAAGQSVSVTRLDFLLSNIALRRADGEWLGLNDWFAYLSPREGRSRFELNNLPAGRYDRLRFQVGVPPEINRRAPSDYPADHPLSPDVNGLHWGWMGGYVFLALEGRWKNLPPTDAGESAVAVGPASEGGYSFHLATDRQLMTVELPLALDLSADRELHLALNVDEILSCPSTITITEGASSTHSRTNDTLADQLRENVERAFSVTRIAAPVPLALKGAGTNKVEIAPEATPYVLAFSSAFPRPALPLDNPLTEEGVELGRRLFFDPRLSVNNSQSCASCHVLASAFSEDKATSIGAEGRIGTRNAMALFNLAWKSSFFWDGRAPTLREQVLMPIQNPIEMHETLTNVVKKLQSFSSRGRKSRQSDPESSLHRLTSAAANADWSDPSAIRNPQSPINYPDLFKAAFGSPDITADRIARALEQFLLTLVSHDAKLDRVMRGQETFSEQEKHGFELFHTEYDPRRRQFGADCFHCHGGPLFQSQAFANNGLDANASDLGRFAVTRRAGDEGKFAVPSLRNVALTAPYMHDGRFRTLEKVVEHYTSEVKRSATLDPNLAKHPGGGVPLSTSDKAALVAFLKTLTDERFLSSTESR